MSFRRRNFRKQAEELILLGEDAVNTRTMVLKPEQFVHGWT